MMIEAGESLSPLTTSRSRELAGELVSKLLLEVEHEAGERPETRAGEIRGQRKDTSFKGDALKKEARSQERAARIIEHHRMLWDKVSKKLVIGLRKTDPKEGLERLKVVKLAGDILSVVVRGQRQAWGLEALESEGAPGDTEEIIAEMASLTAPSRADASLE